MKISPFVYLFLCFGFIVYPFFGWSQCNLLCNTDFEDNQITTTVAIVDTSLVPCWQTTASDNKIEVWSSGYGGVPSYSGAQFVELNAFMVSTLYQNFYTVPGDSLTVSFAHRGRWGVDVMSVEVGPVGGPYLSLGNFSDDDLAWGYYTLIYVIPPGLGNHYSLRFTSVSAAGGNPAIGNFLDAISVNLMSTISSSVTTQASSCNINNGSAQLNVSGGVLPYTYLWMPTGGTNQSANNLASGIYTVQIMDSKGCVKKQTVSIASGGGTFDVSVITHPASCAGQSDGGAEAIVSGSAFPYIYLWSSVGGNQSSVSGLSAGSYTVQIADSSCLVSKNFTIAELTASDFSVIVYPVLCSSNNLVSAEIVGGNKEYSYFWSPMGGNSKYVTGLSVGNYTVVIHDTSNNCIFIKQVAISEQSKILNYQLPNTFTPNDDGVNDILNFGSIENCGDYSVVIYNRWGTKVFYTAHLRDKYWDGKNLAGDDVKEGVYFYILSDASSSFRGSVTIFR